MFIYLFSIIAGIKLYSVPIPIKLFLKNISRPGIFVNHSIPAEYVSSSTNIIKFLTAL